MSNNSMINFDLYKPNKKEQEVDMLRWKPPVSEAVMKQYSEKLSLSSRCWPEYLLASLAYLEQEVGIEKIDSISQLVYFIICEFLNEHMDKIGELPDAEIAMEAFLQRGWIQPDTEANHKKVAKVRRKRQVLQDRIESGKATLKERYEFWKDRDPEKAEAIMQEIFKVAQENMQEDSSEEEQEEFKPSNPNAKSEEPIQRGMSYSDLNKGNNDGIAKDIPENIPTIDEEEDEDN